MLLMLDLKSGVILELELDMKSKGLFNKKLKSEELWDLTSEVLTELSRRDKVSRVDPTFSGGLDQ